MSLLHDLSSPFNEEADMIRYTIDHNIQTAMYSIDKECINGRWVAIDIEQIQRLVKIAVSNGLRSVNVTPDMFHRNHPVQNKEY